MTYPQQPQYGQQPYAPPPQYAPQPQYAPPAPAQQQYAPPPQAPAQQPSAAPGVPTLIDPGMGARWPSWAELDGRLVALTPTRVSMEPNYEKTQDVQTAHFTLYVLDGSWPLYYGASPKLQRPATHLVNGPARFDDATTQNGNIVRAVQDGLARGGTVIGVIQLSTIGNKGNKPWNLTALEKDDPRKQIAAQIFGAIAAGTMQWAVPVELAPPAAPQQAQGYPQAPQQYAQPAQQPYGAPAQQYGQQPPAPPQWAQPAPQPAQQPFPQQGYQAPQFVPQQAPQAYGPPAPQRPEQIPEGIWNQMPPDAQRDAVQQLMNQAAMQAGQQRPNPY